jgi:hypothetical protein
LKGCDEIKTLSIKYGGIRRNEFIEYFLKIGGTLEDAEKIKGPFWEATVGHPTPAKFKSLNIQNVLVSITAEDDEFDDFIAAFQLNFLRCGG